MNKNFSHTAIYFNQVYLVTGTPCCEQLKRRKLKSCIQGSDWLPDTGAGCNSLTDGRLAHLRPALQPHAGHRGFPSRRRGARPLDRPLGSRTGRGENSLRMRPGVLKGLLKGGCWGRRCREGVRHQTTCPTEAYFLPPTRGGRVGLVGGFQDTQRVTRTHRQHPRTERILLGMGIVSNASE